GSLASVRLAISFSTLGLISQYMPVQFERLSLNELNAEPHALILDKIQDVLRAYRYGCSSETA
ncbi:class II D-tagatose-bisphosphate aldolase non-catalytic subunit, partial [Klebsiella pneumoniae]|uniref:class II D-tagatose-bisphosphate aldolase non-catalytic subunit n=1 Tax=Klebsiella pneumoniae TaxID=573 RepID=UPI0024B32AFF